MVAFRAVRAVQDSEGRIKSQANMRRPLGAGTFRPISVAVEIHSCITISTLASASPYVATSAAHPGSSGTSAMNASSSELQYMMISYLYFSGIIITAQLVLNQYSANLLDLGGLRFRPFRL